MSNMKNFRPVRSLIRGLEIIRAINYLGPSSISEISNILNFQEVLCIEC